MSPQLLRLDEQLRYAKAVEHKPWKVRLDAPLSAHRAEVSLMALLTAMQDDIAGDGKPGVPIAQQLPGAAVAKGSMLEETNIGYQVPFRALQLLP